MKRELLEVRKSTRCSVDQLSSCCHFVRDWLGIRLKHSWSQKAMDIQHIRNFIPFSLIYLFRTAQALVCVCMCVCVFVCVYVCTCEHVHVRWGRQPICGFESGDVVVLTTYSNMWGKGFEFSAWSKTPGLWYFIPSWPVGKIQHLCYTQTKECVRDTGMLPGLNSPSSSKPSDFYSPHTSLLYRRS